MIKMSDVKVSIIMTTYNAGKYLREAIDSVKRQDLAEIEIICIDGHSKDNTIDIIKEYQKKDARIKLYTQIKKGIGAAKNLGIEKASGEYITFLDADDFYVDTSALRKMYEACKKFNIRVCGALRSVTRNGLARPNALHRADCNQYSGGVKLYYSERQYDYHFHSYLYERKMICQSDARFAETSVYDDTHFFIRAMLAAKEFYVVPVELYRYRLGPDYQWNMEQTNDCIINFIDQLRISRYHHLEQLHWLTVQRMNYEYRNNFVRNIVEGDYWLLEKLIEANREIDTGIIDRVQSELPSQTIYVTPMMDRNLQDMPLRVNMNNKYMPKYILEPLWEVVNGYRDDRRRLTRELEEIRNSYSFKAGRFITYFPRVIRAVKRKYLGE